MALRLTTVITAVMLAAFAVHSMSSPSSMSPSSSAYVGPKEAYAAPGRWAIKHYHATKRGTVLNRWGHNTYDPATKKYRGFGYRHITGRKHGWYPQRISQTISTGTLLRKQSPTSYVRVKWYTVPQGRYRYRVVYDRRTNSPDGKMLGVVTAYVDLRRPNNPGACSVSPEQTAAQEPVRFPAC